MKKVVSLLVTALLLASSVLPALSQKRQIAESSKKQNVAREATRFASFGAYTDGQGVWLSWQMTAEIGNIGFYVYRVGANGAELLSPAKFVGGAALHGRELPSYGESYSYYDRAGTEDAAYYVEAFSLSGKRTATQQVYPQYVSSLVSLTGLTHEELALRSDPEPTQLERNVPDFTKEIVTEMTEHGIVPDPATHRTVISTPGAVRIGVKNEGLHRVTSDQLRAAGFDADVDSSLWQLYVDGVEQAIIIGKGASYIEFYGKGVDTSETDIKRYYLINGTTPGKRIEQRVATRSTSTVVTPSYRQTFIKKERTQWVDDITNDDADNYFGRGIGSTATTMTFNLTGVDFAVPNASLYLRFQGYSPTVHSVEVTLNDVVLAPSSGPIGEQPFNAIYSIQTSLLREGLNSIKFRSIASVSDYNFLDTVSIDFNRKFIAEQNRISFYTTNYRAARLDGFASANVRVFDITRESSPVVMTNLDFQSSGGSFG